MGRANSGAGPGAWRGAQQAPGATSASAIAAATVTQALRAPRCRVPPHLPPPRQARTRRPSIIDEVGPRSSWSVRPLGGSQWWLSGTLSSGAEGLAGDGKQRRAPFGGRAGSSPRLPWAGGAPPGERCWGWGRRRGGGVGAARANGGRRAAARGRGAEARAAGAERKGAAAVSAEPGAVCVPLPPACAPYPRGCAAAAARGPRSAGGRACWCARSATALRAAGCGLCRRRLVQSAGVLPHSRARPGAAALVVKAAAPANLAARLRGCCIAAAPPRASTGSPPVRTRAAASG